MKNHETLKCMLTGMEIIDDGLILSNENSTEPSLLRTVYLNKKFKIKNDLPGLFKFSNWLPVNKVIDGSSAPLTYLSKHLGDSLKLKNLYLTFNGYWPERGIKMTTGSFKECEAYSVCARFPHEKTGKKLVIASAGNTAKAFIKVCSENNIPLVVVVPEQNKEEIWSSCKTSNCVKIILAAEDSDYSDAIKLAELICKNKNFQNEGGAKNVARRDGLGTTVLSAVNIIGEIPDYYYQAIGSGTGAIAAFEANLRLNESGNFSNKLMKQHLVQNFPFIPIYNAWKNGRNKIEISELDAKNNITNIDAKTLSNRNPPYSIKGGLYETLDATNGEMFSVSNEQIKNACTIFEKLEGIDICPEAGAAIAALIKNVENKIFEKDSIILVNITGGGKKRILKDFNVYFPKTDLIVRKSEFNDEIGNIILNLFD